VQVAARQGTAGSPELATKSLGGGTGGGPPTHSRGSRDRPAPDHPRGRRPLRRHVVGHQIGHAVNHDHVVHQLVSKGPDRRGTAPDDTKMLDTITRRY